MVIKTEQCAFSESRVYPGHGSRYVRKDGASYIFISKKCKSLFLQRKKPSKLTWTLGWRRMNKKIKVEEVNRRARKKTTKFQRAVVGVSAEEINKKRNVKPEIRAAARDAALKEAKERSKANKALKKTAGKSAKVGAPARSMKKSGNRGKM